MVTLINGDEQRLTGKFNLIENSDDQISFLKKYSELYSKIILDKNKLIPLSAAYFSHQIRENKNSIDIDFLVKNKGKETLKLLNPLLFYQSNGAGPHDPFLIKIDISKVGVNDAFTSIEFNETNIASNQSLEPVIEIKPQEIKKFTFSLMDEQLKSIPKGTFNLSVSASFPSPVSGSIISIVTEEQKLSNKF